MTTLEAQVAQSAEATAAEPEKASATPSPAAPAPGDVSQANTISEYQAAKAALLAAPPPQTDNGTPPPPATDEIESQILRDEFGDEVHNPDKDAEAGYVPPPVEAPVQTQTPPPPPEGQQAPAEQVPPVEQPDRLLPHRINTKQFDRTEQEALALKHDLETENPGQKFSLKECLARVEAKYGAQPTPAQPDPNALDPNLPQSLADLETQRREAAKAIREKRAEIAKAETELRYDDKLALVGELNELETKVDTLEDYRPRLLTHEEARQAEFIKAYQTSAAQVESLYPAAKVTGSPFYVRMAEIDELFRTTNDPRYNALNKPLMIAQMVAQEQNVAPRAQTAAPPAPAPQVQQQRPSASAPQPPVVQGNSPVHLTAPVASGSARTTTPALTNAEAAIAAVKTPEQLEMLKLQLLGRHAA